MKAIRKKTIKKKTILWCAGVISLMLVYGLILYFFTAHYIAVHGEKVDAKEFVEYLISHSDEAAADFEAYGLTFEKAEEEVSIGLYENNPWMAEGSGDILVVTDTDGWRFYYQTLKKYGDQLIKVEGSREREFPLVGRKRNEKVTGTLSIERWYGYRVIIEVAYVKSGDHVHFTKRCKLPDFEDCAVFFVPQVDSIDDIKQWITDEELEALYNKGKDLEEILSAYCELKR